MFQALCWALKSQGWCRKKYERFRRCSAFSLEFSPLLGEEGGLPFLITSSNSAPSELIFP